MTDIAGPEIDCLRVIRGEYREMPELRLTAAQARRLFGLKSDEVLHGVTRHAARALGLQERCGKLTAGLDADFAVWSIATLDELGYWIGFNPCSMVVRGGEIVLERDV